MMIITMTVIVESWVPRCFAFVPFAWFLLGAENHSLDLPFPAACNNYN